jgi:hypothetical protein
MCSKLARAFESPPPVRTFFQTSSFEVHFGGRSSSACWPVHPQRIPCRNTVLIWSRSLAVGGGRDGIEPPSITPLPCVSLAGLRCRLDPRRSKGNRQQISDGLRGQIDGPSRGTSPDVIRNHSTFRILRHEYSPLESNLCCFLSISWKQRLVAKCNLLKLL